MRWHHQPFCAEAYAQTALAAGSHSLSMHCTLSPTVHHTTTYATKRSCSPHLMVSMVWRVCVVSVGGWVGGLCVCVCGCDLCVRGAPEKRDHHAMR